MALTPISIAAQLAAGARAAAERGASLSAALSPAVVTDDLIDALPRRRGLWQHAHLFLADTRFGLRGETASAVRARLAALPVGPHGLHLQVADGADPLSAAAAYEQHLRAHFALKPGELPRYDFVVLPAEPQREDLLRLAVAVFSPGGQYVTLTPPVIRNARAVLIAKL
jgi:hypothetical protein